MFYQEVELITGFDLSWAVIYTKPRQEARAKENLEGLGLDVSSPLRPIEKARGGVISVDFEPLFPRYLFVRIEPIVFQKVLHTLRNVRGVSQLVKFGGRLAELDEQTFKKIMSLQEEISLLPVKAYQSGDGVIFTHGAFRDISAVYEESDGDRRVILLFDLLGKSARLSVPVSAVKRG